MVLDPFFFAYYQGLNRPKHNNPGHATVSLRDAHLYVFFPKREPINNVCT
jgi:hypothetical protein